MDFNPIITWFSNARSNVPSSDIDVLSILDLIRKGIFSERVDAIRNEEDKKKRDKLKKDLPAVTWSGYFSKRNAENLDIYSGIICHDIDNLDAGRIEQLKEELAEDVHVLAAFVSPSGNGLKVLFRVSTPPEMHLQAWQAIGAHLSSCYDIKPDEACKDICRLCFVSHDPDMLIRENANIINDVWIRSNLEREEEQKRETNKASNKKVPAQDTITYTDQYALLEKCHEITIRTHQPVDGSYNKYINLFTIQAKRFGLDKDLVASQIAEYCGWVAPDKDDWAVINSVYDNPKFEFGAYTKNSKSVSRSTRTLTKAPESVGISATKYDSSTLFWYVVRKTDKNTGEVSEEYKYSYDDAIIFLQNNGFYKYQFENNRYQLIHVDITNNMVEIVTELRVKEFMIDFLKTDPSQEYKRVREMFRRGAKNYCSSNILEGLDYYKPVLKTDTQDTAYVYFKNCFLEVTKEGIAAKDYGQLDGMIWRKQVIDIDFTVTDFQSCDFNRFIWYSITGRKVDQDKRDPEEIRMYDSVCTTIGYLLHRYKSPALTKAVIAVDKKIRRTGEANGRSGKSLFSKALGKMLNMVILDGPNFKFDYEFCFQQCNIDTALVNFNDVTKNFDFSRLFGMITEEFTFSKKKIDSITIPFSEAPKFYISTNFTLKGDGESNKGRQQIIEFSTYFNSENTPAKEFGRMFFYEWDAQEWHSFYSFMVHCIKMYLQNGLIDFPLENYGMNKLIDTAGDEFIDYLDEVVKGQLSHVREFDSGQLFEKYKTLSRKTELKKNTFGKWVKMYCDVNGLLLNDHKNGERDRRNGIDYYTFKEAHPSAVTNEIITVDNLATDTGELPF